jgi:DNA polymerase epsilon subunit 1
MLNADVNANFSNHQYQSLNKETGQYSTRSECSIFFEVDGPYRCMVLPSSTEEGKLLKKRYAVFNFDGSLAELKGFELKRRGELELIKAFQSQVFERFLDGKSLEECYGAVAEIANHWMDVLDTQGESLDTEELFDLISENRNMSRQLEEYGNQKGTSQTTARRLGEFLGAEIIKDKGLNCKFIIAERPHGAPVTERAIPTAIWKAESAVKKHFLRKWLKAPEIEDFDVRNIIDWDYYRERLAKTIQKIITIPAALQGVVNPVPRIAHPDWLHKTVARKSDRLQQQSLVSMFQNVKKDSTVDIEDTMGTGSKGSRRPLVHAKKRRTKTPTASLKQNSAEMTKSPSKTNSSSTVLIPSHHTKLSNDSFSEWLAQRKKSWRSARWDRRKTRKRIHQTTSTSNTNLVTNGTKKSRKPAGSMMGYLQDAALAVQQEEWQVIEIRETSHSSGEFVVWIMIGGKSLQRIQLTAPRTIYVNCLEPIKAQDANSELSLKKVERFLPHGKGVMHLYEVEMSEQVFQSHVWEKVFLSGCGGNSQQMVENIYESNTPLLYQVLIKLGSITRVAPGVEKTKGVADKAFSLNELTRVEKPSIDYLHSGLSYRRIFLYDGINSKSKTGVVALFIMEGGSGECSQAGIDVTRPELKEEQLRVDAKCLLWVVKPGAIKVQKAISKEQCSSLFSQLLSHIVDLARDEEEGDDKLSCLSPISKCHVGHLGFVENERTAFAQVDDSLKHYLQEKRGPTFLLANSISKALPLLRKALPNSIEFPTFLLPLPSGEHVKRMPPLNWEPIAVQLCLEAYFHMGAVSFPRRVRNARFGSIPIGNLGVDDSLMLYDVSLGRRMRKARALLWSNPPLGVPDLGCSVFEAGDSSSLSTNELSTSVWSDDNTLSPVVCNPGSYRTICVEVDIHNLAIAALMDPNAALLESGRSRNNSTKDQRLVGDSTLGDAMSCSLCYHLLRGMVQSWLSEAFERNSVVADDLLHHLYRIVCTPESFLHDPALHRVIHSNMMSMFHRLLSELHLLGARIISANFSRVVIATKKTNVDAAQEYINFMIATVKKRGCGQGLDRITLRPNKLWSHYNLMDEYNLSGIHLQERDPQTEDEAQWAFVESGQHFVPAPICAWNTSNYLAG